MASKIRKIITRGSRGNVTNSIIDVIYVVVNPSDVRFKNAIFAPRKIIVIVCVADTNLTALIM